MTWLGLGRLMRLLDVEHSGLAVRETYNRAGDYNTQHKDLNDTPEWCASVTPLFQTINTYTVVVQWAVPV